MPEIVTPEPPPESETMDRIPMMDWHLLRDTLRTDGFCVVPRLLEPAFVRRLRSAADELGERWTEKLGDALRAQGSMVSTPYMTDPVFAELISYRRSLSALDALGLDGSAFTAGYVISKPPRSPRLFWHYDWYGWEDPHSVDPEPFQLFVMYYLTDTSEQNGCLRVVPGSHLCRHSLHDVMADGHRDLREATDLSRPEFGDAEGEVAVPVRAGDAILGDARLLHAAHSNETGERRSLVTLWYHPHFDHLPERVKATFLDYVQDLPDNWSNGDRAAVEQLRPDYRGPAEPLSRTLNGPPSNHTADHTS